MEKGGWFKKFFLYALVIMLGFSSAIPIFALTQTITFNPSPIPSQTYGGTLILGATASSGLAIVYITSTPATISIAGNVATFIGAGAANITATQPGNGTYSLAPNVPRNFTVNKAVFTVKADNQTRLYGQANPVFTISYSGFVNGDNMSVITMLPTATCPAIATTAVGNQTITAAGGVVNSNYTIAYATGTLVIIKATFIATAVDTFRVYGIANPVFRILYAGFTNGQTNALISPKPIASAATATSTASAGATYPINLTGTGTTNYNLILTTGSLTITQKTQTITFAVIPAKTYGNPPFALSGSASSALPVTFTSSDPTIASIAGITVTILQPGSVTITATQPGNINFSSATAVSKLFTIAKKAQAISFANLPTITYSNAPFALTGTSNSGLAVSYISSNPSIASIAGNVVTILQAGSVTITAIQTGDVNYNAATVIVKTLTINIASQTINFPPILPINFGVADFDPGATASSGLPITYYIDYQTVATIVNGKIHTNGVGTCTITAMQLGSTNYSSAISVTQTLTVIKSLQIITFPNISPKTYKDPDFGPGATSNTGSSVNYSSDNPSVAIIAWGKVRIVGAGTAYITAYRFSDPNYTDASIVKKLVVNKAPQTITFTSLPVLTYGCEDYYPGGTSSSNLDVSYQSDNLSVATIINSRIHVIKTGTAKITSSQAGNSNYLPAADVSLQLTVVKADQLITFDGLPIKNYNTPDFALSASATSGLLISYTSINPAVASVTNGIVHINESGTTIIKASQAGNANYNAAPDVLQTLTVNKAPQTITFNSFPAKIFGDPDFTPVVSSSSGLSVSLSSDNPSVATIVSGKIHIITTGTANITASQSGDANYCAASSASQQLIVKNENQNISFNPLGSKTYGDIDFPLSASASSGLPVSFISDNSYVATIISGQVHITGAGSATIFAVQDGNAYFNAATMVPQTLLVNKATQNITFGPLPAKTYIDNDFNPGAVSLLGFPISYSSNNNAVAMIVGDQIHIFGVGTAVISAWQAGNGNYTSSPILIQTLTVSKASQAITFASIPSKKYGSANFSLVTTASSGLQISYISSNPSVATVTNGVVHIVSVGITTITASQPGDDNYNAALQIQQNLIVIKNSQVITLNAVPTLTYGDDDFELSATSSSGLPVTFSSNNPSVVTVINGWLHILGSGSAILTATQIGNTNFDAAAPAIQAINIRKHLQDIYFDTIPIHTYGDADFDPGAVTNSGLAVSYYTSNSSVTIIKSGKIHIVGAGTSTITARQQGNNNYEAVTDVSHVCKITKALLTTSADNFSRKYNTNNPPFTYSYSGFVNGDAAADIDAMPSVVTNAIISSTPGKYNLIPQAGQDNNYEFAYQNGILTILGTNPLKPVKPIGTSLLCINPVNQTYTTSGGIFASTYEWEIIPSIAGKWTGTGKSATMNFEDSFTGRAGIITKGKNNIGISESSDTLYVTILSQPSVPQIKTLGKYCSNSSIGDSIILINPQPYYSYQLLSGGNILGTITQNNADRAGWFDLKEGTYNISEILCNVSMATDITIRQVQPTSIKPLITSKWNDVLVCINHGDSVINYTWYKNGEVIPNENKQFLWTQQKQGNYSVSITDDIGCQFTSDNVSISPSSDGIVYPNPNHGEFKVSFTSAEKGKVVLRIANMNSLPVNTFSYQKDIDTFEQEIKASGTAAGIYYVDVMLNGKRVFYEKLIIE